MAKTRADSRRGSGREMSARWKPRRCAIPDRSARLSRHGGGRAELQFLRIDWPSVQRRVLEVVLPQPPWGPVTLQRQGLARTGEIARCFFYNDTAPTEIYSLSLHDALPILALALVVRSRCEVLKASVKALVFGM